MKNEYFSICNVTVLISNINDESPVFQNNNYKFNVAENQPQGTVVGMVKAEDKDSNQLQYEIEGTKGMSWLALVDLLVFLKKKSF